MRWQKTHARTHTDTDDEGHKCGPRRVWTAVSMEAKKLSSARTLKIFATRLESHTRCCLVSCVQLVAPPPPPN